MGLCLTRAQAQVREPRCRPKTFLGLLPRGSRFSVPCYLTRSVSVSTGPSVRTNSPELSESWLLVPEALYVSPPCTSTGTGGTYVGPGTQTPSFQDQYQQVNIAHLAQPSPHWDRTQTRPFQDQYHLLDTVLHEIRDPWFMARVTYYGPNDS